MERGVVTPALPPVLSSVILEKEMATHSNILASRTPWREEPEGHSPSGRQESDMTERLSPVML